LSIGGCKLPPSPVRNEENRPIRFPSTVSFVRGEKEAGGRSISPPEVGRTQSLFCMERREPPHQLHLIYVILVKGEKEAGGRSISPPEAGQAQSRFRTERRTRLHRLLPSPYDWEREGGRRAIDKPSGSRTNIEQVPDGTKNMAASAAPISL